MKKKIKKDKEEPFKISATIYTNEELEKLDHKIGNDLDEIVNQVTEAVLTKREEIVLQKVIEKQQKEIEDLKNGHIDFWINTKEVEDMVRGKFISKDKIREKIDLIDKEYAEIIEKNKNDLYLVNINAQRHSAMQSILEELLGE